MKRAYTVYQGDEVSTIEYDAEEKRRMDRDERDEERTRIAESIRHAIETLERVDSRHEELKTSVSDSQRLLRDALHRIVGTRS